MPKCRVTDYEILCQLDRGLPESVVADQLGVPIRRVARVMTGGRSAHDTRKPQQPQYGTLLPQGIHLACAPSPATAAYWAALQEPAPPKPRRMARMVPDDRADEGLTFEEFMTATEVVFVQAGREDREGRGAA